MISKLFLIIIIAVILWVPSGCQAEFYLGGYVGINFAGNVDPAFWGYQSVGLRTRIDQTLPQYVYAVRNAHNVRSNPAFLGGVKLGTWFDKIPIIGYELPKFFHYFGFEVDIGYHGLDWPKQRVAVTPTNRSYDLQNTGSVIPVCFMVMGRYGFWPDEIAPWGRLQPYVGIGPALVVSNQYLNIGTDYRSTEADLGLAIETGIRYFLTKKISTNVAFRYQYVNLHLDSDDTLFDLPRLNIPMYTRYHFFNFFVGVGYHFF